MSACRTLATRGVPGLTRSSRREPSYLQSHHGRHSCQQGRLGQGHQERQEHPGVQQGRSHHGHPGRGGEQRPVSPRGRGPVGPGEQQTQLWPGGRSRLTLGPGDPSRPGEPSAPGDPCREREGGRHQPGGGRLRPRPQGPCGGHWHRTGLATAYLTSRLARGSSQSRGAHGTRGATFATGARRTLFARFALREKEESGQRWGGGPESPLVS